MVTQGSGERQGAPSGATGSSAPTGLEPIYLGLGSNLGNRRRYLELGCQSLEERGIRIIRRSPLYETLPVGGPPQGDFLNAVIEVRVNCSPLVLLSHCLEVEKRLGRTRSQRWEERTLDIDLLLWGELTMNRAELCLPHPRLATRAFVLIPLADLDAELHVPGQGRVADLLKSVGGHKGVRLHTPSW